MAEPPEEQSRIVVAEPAEDIARRYGLEQTRMRYESGWLGLIFGSATNAPTSIAGIIVILLTLASIAVLFVPSNIPSGDYLNSVLPVIAVIVGYLFGKCCRN
jgi:hypothetical protein